MQKPASNAAIVENAKSILDGLGYEVKTGHIYELLSRLCGHKSWNHASAAKIDFSEKVPFSAADNPQGDVSEEAFFQSASDPRDLWHRLLNALGISPIMLRDEKEVAIRARTFITTGTWNEVGDGITSTFVFLWGMDLNEFYDGLKVLVPANPSFREDFEDVLERFDYTDLLFIWFAFPTRSHALFGLRSHINAKRLENWLTRARPGSPRDITGLERYMEAIPDAAYDYIRSHLPPRLINGQLSR
ncbi:MAG TPA: hypothetical protein VE954_27425 [Oligoflexus sp.]|uniref:hypothetical protein n=1 Tax=Oligoflexus sp. TaxID=1971216 RepID=UPI002D59C0CF|nr:hypothetical protein [Oligoflexus sp.]HYX36856.1 hypothetical protein [Oligoflexus sp.]